MAVLEQWEIDLRNQLLEGSESQREWEDRLKQELEGIPSRKKKKNKPKPTPVVSEPVVERPPIALKKKKEEGLLGYYVIIVLLIVMGLFVYNHKSGGALTNWFANRIQFAETEEKKLPEMRPDSAPMPPPNNSAEISQLRLDVAKMKQDMETLNTKLKWNSDRITLMGMLVNENFVILGNNYDRSHLIFFNADWTINKMPRYLQIQEKDREYLQKFVKPGAAQ